MKSDLRKLVNAEEAFDVDSLRYTAMLDTTVTGRRRRKSITVTESGLIFRSLHRRGRARDQRGSRILAGDDPHSQIANFSCGIAVNTANPLDDSVADGIPVCK